MTLWWWGCIHFAVSGAHLISRKVFFAPVCVLRNSCAQNFTDQILKYFSSVWRTPWCCRQQCSNHTMTVLLPCITVRACIYKLCTSGLVGAKASFLAVMRKLGRFNLHCHSGGTNCFSNEAETLLLSNSWSPVGSSESREKHWGSELGDTQDSNPETVAQTN